MLKAGMGYGIRRWFAFEDSECLSKAFAVAMGVLPWTEAFCLRWCEGEKCEVAVLR